MKSRGAFWLFVVCWIPILAQVSLFVVTRFVSLDDPRHDFSLLLLGVGIWLGQILATIISGGIVFLGKEERIGSWRPWFVLFLVNAAFLAMFYYRTGDTSWAQPTESHALPTNP